MLDRRELFVRDLNFIVYGWLEMHLTHGIILTALQKVSILVVNMVVMADFVLGMRDLTVGT